MAIGTAATGITGIGTATGTTLGIIGGPVGWWAAGYWAGDALSAIPWSWGYWPYYNPYYAGPVVDGSATIDYSQPIVVAQAAASPPVAQRV